jgi:lipopolysaccharide export system permease protein
LRIFKKSLSVELISTATAIFLILVGIILAQRAGYFVSMVAKGILPNDAVSTLLGFNMVKFLPLILSLTIFLSALLTLTRWHRDSEMAIWFSSGLSIYNWIRPTLAFALPIILIILLLSLFVMPWAIHKGESYRLQLKNRDEFSSVSPGTFKESRNGEKIYFIEGLDQLGSVVKNVFMQSKQNQKTSILFASNGQREKAKNGDHFLALEHGRQYRVDADTDITTTTEFEKYAIRIETKEAAPETSTIQSKSTLELIKEDSLPANAELQWRMAIPISALILVILAIPLSFVDPRAGRSLNMMFAIFIYIIYNNVLSIFQAWVTQGRLSPMIGLWPAHLFFLLFAWYLFYRRDHLLPIFPSIFKVFKK